MPPVLPFRQSMTTSSLDTSAIEPLATCPACHSVEPTLTMAAVAAGATWQCARCTQRWHAGRLATVAGYRSWDAQHVIDAGLRATSAGGGL